MPGVPAASSPVRSRRLDISSWVEGDLSALGEREKKRYEKRKNAIIEYFTTADSVEEITLRNHLSQETLQKLADKCLKRHADGHLWGFRALLPGAAVIDHAAPAEEVAEREDALPDVQARRLEALSAQPQEVDEDGEVTARLVAIKIPREYLRRSPQRQPGQSEDQDEPRQPAEEASDSAETPVERAQNGRHPSAVAPLAEPLVEELPTRSLEAMKVEESKGGEESGSEASEEEEERTELEEKPATDLPASSPAVPAAAAADGLATLPTQILEQVSPPQSIAQAPQAAAVQRIAADDAEMKIYPDLEELTPTLVDEHMLPAPLDDEARLDLLPGADREHLEQAPTAVLPLYNGASRRLAFENHVTQQLRRIRGRRRDRQVERRKRHRLRTYLTLALVIALLIGLLPPLGAALAAYSAYNNVKGVAEDGVNHLLAVKNLLTLDKNDPLAALDADKLQRAQQEFRLASNDFVQLQQLVVRADVRAAIQQFAPEYTPKLDMARHLVQVALDVSRMGDEMSGIGIMAAGIIHGSPLSGNTSKPLLTAQDIAAVQGSLIHALYYIDDIGQQMHYVDLNQLPMITPKERGQISSVLTSLPKIEGDIVQAQQMVPLVSWLLGVDGERHFLLQTMDNAELRPGGGFTGQYGIVDIKNGVVGPLSLRDVAKLDYAGNGYQMGRQAPPGYSWMHMGNFGLRDSNISGDYPTTARINLQVFQDEGGGPVDGDIAFTPTFIAHILDVTGPIQVKDYGETITSKNLADRLHYYQQDPAGIARQEQITGQGLHDARKAFTSLVAKLLLDKVRHMPVSKLLAIVKGAVRDIQARDLELYFTNSAVESWLVQQGYSGAINSFKNIDGFHVVQANISVSKASQYVHSTFEDDITLDAQGGATHNLTITLQYDQRGPVYGFDTYTDYIRVYAPAGAQFISGSGFDSGQPVCSGGTKPPSSSNGKQPPSTGGKCDSYNYIPPDGSRYCPSGNYSLGARYQNPPVDKVGPPTALQSDLPGRSMWGGLTETPKNCTSYITLSWYVPHAHINPKNPTNIYSVLVGKQGGMVPTVKISIDASALHLKGVKNLQYQGDIHADQKITLKGPQPKPATQTKTSGTPVPTSTPPTTPNTTSIFVLPTSWRRM